MRTGIGSLLFAACLAAASAGCLPDAKAPEGRLLFASRDIQRPGFVILEGKPWVMFDVQTVAARPPGAAISDVHLVNWETAEDRVLVRNRSERWHPQVDDVRGHRYYMVDEQPVGLDRSVPTATLVKLSFTEGEVERIPDVTSFSLYGHQLLYRRMMEASPWGAPNLFLRNSSGVERGLGDISGAAEVVGEGRMYFVGGADRTLARLDDISAPVVPIRKNVGRFLLGPGETYAALAVTDMGKSDAFILDLSNDTEHRLPGLSACCWLGFRGSEFVYSELAVDGTAGTLHYYDLATKQDRSYKLAQDLVDVATMIGRPTTGSFLIQDSRGRAALFDPMSGDPMRALFFRPYGGNFTPDGRHFVFIDPLVTSPLVEGTLMVQDAAFLQPPRQVSPLGTLVSATPPAYFFMGDGERSILVYWGHIGRSSSNLYFGDIDSGQARLVAEGISEVTVRPDRLIGIVRVSQQDLVGDLVIKELMPGGEESELVVAHRVADATFWGGHVAFVVRERVPWTQNGLWATTIE